MSGLRFHGIALLLLMVLAFLQYRLWFESGGIRDMLQLKKNLTQQAEENDALKKQNEDLLLQVKQIKSNPDAIESRARDELGMIKKDEVFYQVIRSNKSDEIK
ncbi:MAG: hypothetical protein A3F14_01940 [Gammaproteobacteria bacterium RIFCSPHIGHO2_12_FULL_43_28]|nr:MAG: hypothetical protein A3F14_01940 [Gammaproteobacteria bacterium RIFCSPHIGHO2_12_FULL_43_28]